MSTSNLLIHKCIFQYSEHNKFEKKINHGGLYSFKRKFEKISVEK